MKFIKLLFVVLVLLGCSHQVNESESTTTNQTTKEPEVTTIGTTISPSVTTTMAITTTVPVTTTTPITTTVTTTTVTTITTTTTTSVIEEVGSTLSPVTSDYLMRMIEDKETFYAYLGTTTCPHCQAYKPVVEQVVSLTPNINFFVVMLDVDTGSRQSELLDFLQLEYIPLTIQVVDGEIVDQYVGEMNTDQLIEFMN